MDALIAQGLEKAFGRRKALSKISFDLPEGASLAVFGPNGAGKTTLLRILATLERPTAGTFSLFGASLEDAPDAIRRRLGLISHNPMLYLDLTAEENLLLYARLYGVPEPERRVRQLLDAIELTHRGGDAVRGFSRGMTQRVSIARALVHDPDLVLLDEPYSGLDPHAARIVDRLFEPADGRDGRSRTIVTVSHDLERGWNNATHILLLARGSQILFAPKDALTFDEMKRIYEAQLEGGVR